MRLRSDGARIRMDRPMNAPVTYIPGWVGDSCGRIFEHLLGIAWVHRETEGRPAPRKEYWTNTYERPYTYGSGIGQRTYEPQPPDPVIDEVREAIAAHTGHVLEGCFLNRYDGGLDSLNWHADDDSGIDHSKPIAVVTLGTARSIQFKSIEKGSHPQTLLLDPGSLLLMHAGMQSTHRHRIPKEPSVTGTRISMTFRGLVPG